jgi:hypothetical protein
VLCDLVDCCRFVWAWFWEKIFEVINQFLLHSGMVRYDVPLIIFQLGDSIYMSPLYHRFVKKIQFSPSFNHCTLDFWHQKISSYTCLSSTCLFILCSSSWRIFNLPWIISYLWMSSIRYSRIFFPKEYVFFLTRTRKYILKSMDKSTVVQKKGHETPSRNRIFEAWKC